MVGCTAIEVVGKSWRPFATDCIKGHLPLVAVVSCRLRRGIVGCCGALEADVIAVGNPGVRRRRWHCSILQVSKCFVEVKADRWVERGDGGGLKFRRK